MAKRDARIPYWKLKKKHNELLQACVETNENFDALVDITMRFKKDYASMCMQYQTLQKKYAVLESEHNALITEHVNTHTELNNTKQKLVNSYHKYDDIQRAHENKQALLDAFIKENQLLTMDLQIINSSNRLYQEESALAYKSNKGLRDRVETLVSWNRFYVATTVLVTVAFLATLLKVVVG